MSNGSPLHILPLRYDQFSQLPDGFTYPHAISATSNTTAFDTGVDTRDKRCCIVCSYKSRGGLHPGVQRTHIIPQCEEWDFLKHINFVPRFAKSVAHEPRSAIILCDRHHSDYEGYRFFVRWVPSEHAFVLVNFSRDPMLEPFHGKIVALDPDHHHSPFPAPFIIQEMRVRGFYPWFTDRPILRPLELSYNPVVDSGNNEGVGMLEPDVPMGFDGNGNSVGPPGNGADARAAMLPNQQYIMLGNPFQDPELLNTMRREWQQLRSWKAANIEGLSWDGTAEENVKKYAALVGLEGD